MGCDIHAFFERRTNTGWKLMTGFMSDLYDPDHEYFSQNKFRRTSQPLQNRNYTLFAILADVRNYGKEIIPIDEPRGLPDDMSSRVAAYLSGDSDLHSASWLTIEEILNYPWDEKIQTSGYIDSDGVKAIKAGRIPDYAYTRKPVHIPTFQTIPEYEEAIRNNAAIGVDNYRALVYAEWEECPRNYCGSFHDIVLAQLLKRRYHPRDMRMVFAFDN